MEERMKEERMKEEGEEQGKRRAGRNLATYTLAVEKKNTVVPKKVYLAKNINNTSVRNISGTEICVNWCSSLFWRAFRPSR